MNDNRNIKPGNRVLSIIFVSIGTILLILSVFVVCVENFAFNRDYYEEEYAKFNTSAYVGVQYDVLNNATDILLDYLEGNRENIDYRYDTGIETKEYYTEREKAHMVDVAALNQNAVNFAKAGFPTGAALILLAYIIGKHPYIFFKTIFITTLSIIAFFAVLGACAAFDFDMFWINFHKIFFTNDLWLLDPRTSLMIRMFSAEFFFDMVTGILIIFVTLIISILFISGLLSHKFRNNYNK